MTLCPDLLALDDEGLLRYILGEETPGEDRQHHLEQCPICKQRLSDYKELHNLLLPQLYRAECPDAMHLSLYCEHMLSRKETSAINMHLRECLLCVEEISTIRHELARFTPSSESEAFSLSQLLQKPQRITARLLQPQLVPTRQEASQWPRHYQSPTINLLLDRSSTGEHQLLLVGILLWEDEEQTRAHDGTTVDLYLLKDERSSIEMTPVGKTIEQPLLSTTMDDLGHFSFAPLQQGYYAIILHLPNMELVIEQVYLE